MKIHEFQAKQIMADYGIPVPAGQVATDINQAARITSEIGRSVVVKAQIHAGGRGKAGGIRLADSPEEAQEAAEALLGTRLVTEQTGPGGAPVEQVLIEEAIETQEELYMGIAIDGATRGIVILASEQGGSDIEEVSRSSPEKLIRLAIDPMLGLQPYQSRKLAYGLNVPQELVRTVSSIAETLYAMFVANDCSLAEINPLSLTKDRRVIAMDAKIDVDDDAIFRHPELLKLQDPQQEDWLELKARSYNINYVRLSGDVGCIVNGAGLAMATMDLTTAAGATPANFLDIGGGADELKVAQALKIVLSDDVIQVFVNLFGGILRCDVAARGLIMAAKEMPERMRPMVIRMLGTNADEGRRILLASGLDITFVDDLSSAAKAIKIS